MLGKYKTELVKKNILTEDIYLFNFKLIDPPEINFIAGQYMILNIPQPGKELVKRLYSIASGEINKNNLEFIVEIVPDGLASTYLSNLKVGSEMFLDGPAGMFVLRKNENNKVFLATGTGIAPIRSMILSNVQHSALNVKLYWGLRYFKDAYLFDELKKIAGEYPNFQFKICLSREENLDAVPEQHRKYFSLGHVDKEIDNLCLTFNVQHSTLVNTDFYICGGRDVVESLKQCLAGKGVVQDKIFSEKF